MPLGHEPFGHEPLGHGLGVEWLGAEWQDTGRSEAEIPSRGDQ
jgi:hypothetical protein